MSTKTSLAWIRPFDCRAFHTVRGWIVQRIILLWLRPSGRHRGSWTGPLPSSDCLWSSEYHVTVGGKQAPEPADRADLFLPPYTNCSVRHDRESPNEVCSEIGEHMGSNRDPRLCRGPVRQRSQLHFPRRGERPRSVARRSRPRGIALKRLQDRPHQGGGHQRRT